MLSRHVLRTRDFVQLEVEGLSFPRRYVLVLPAYGEPPQQVAELIERLRERATQLQAEQ